MADLLNVSEIIEFAIDIEKNGFKFYTETIKKIPDKKMRELFQYLADEELKHEQLFRNLLKEVGSFTPPESYSGEYQDYKENFLKSHALGNKQILDEKISGITKIEDAVNMALDFEKDSIVLFAFLKKQVGEKNQNQVELIIQEEINHILKINKFINELN